MKRAKRKKNLKLIAKTLIRIRDRGKIIEREVHKLYGSWWNFAKYITKLEEEGYIRTTNRLELTDYGREFLTNLYKYKDNGKN